MAGWLSGFTFKHHSVKPLARNRAASSSMSSRPNPSALTFTRLLHSDRADSRSQHEPDAFRAAAVRQAWHPAGVRSSRMRFSGLRLGCTWLGALLVASSAASADDAAGTQRVALSYAGPAECPDAAEFTSEVQRRSPNAEIVAEGGAPRALRVTLSAGVGGYDGILEFWSADGQRLQRGFRDPSCRQVVSALALVAALSITPHPESPTPLPQTPPITAAPPVPAVASAPPAVTAASPPVGIPGPRKSRWVFGAGASAALVWGPAPEPLTALSPLLVLEQRPRRWSSLTLRLAPMLAQTGVLGARSETARFRLLALRSEVCSARALVGAWGLGPCLFLDLGMLDVKGELPKSFERTRGWYAVGLGADLSWEATLFARVAGGALFPLVRDRFVVLPDKELIHQPPIVAASISLAGGVLFP